MACNPVQRGSTYYYPQHNGKARIPSGGISIHETGKKRIDTYSDMEDGSTAKEIVDYIRSLGDVWTTGADILAANTNWKRHHISHVVKLPFIESKLDTTKDGKPNTRRKLYRWRTDN